MDMYFGKILNGFYYSTSGAMVKFNLDNFAGTEVKFLGDFSFFVIKVTKKERLLENDVVIMHKTMEEAKADAHMFTVAVNELLEKRATATAVPADVATAVSTVSG